MITTQHLKLEQKSFLTPILKVILIKKKLRLASARAGNVIGGGDLKKNRIIPDIYKSIKSGKKLIIRNPQSIRPWQHVLEPLSGYLILGLKLLGRKFNKKCPAGLEFRPREP